MKRLCQSSIFLFFTGIILLIGCAAADTMAPALNPLPKTATLAPPTLIPSAPDVRASSYVLMASPSGVVVAQKNMDERRPPASLTKIMTLYLAFQALKSGAMKLDSKVRISEKAWRMGGSKMFVKVGSEVSVEDLIRGVVVQSGNDACVALAEFIAGSEESFVDLMNQQAKLLGMNNTHYIDCTGMPNADHYTTAHDLAVLTQKMVVNFPEYYHYFSEKWFVYNNIRQPNRNRLLWRFQGADGLKTGHTDDAGFCLVASAVQDGERFITVLLNASTDEVRAEDSVRLLTYGFRFFASRLIYRAGTVLSLEPVWFGDPASVPVGVEHDFYITVPQNSLQNIRLSIEISKDLEAPIPMGAVVGTIHVLEGDREIEQMPVVALKTVKKGGYLRIIVDRISHMFHSFSGKMKPPMIVSVIASPVPNSHYGIASGGGVMPSLPSPLKS